MSCSFIDPLRDDAIVGLLLLPSIIQKRVFSRKNVHADPGSPFFSVVSLLDFPRNAFHLRDRRDCKTERRVKNFSVCQREG